MRESKLNYGWMESEEGDLQGFNLGYDFCAEHEASIKGLLSAFGVDLPDSPVGIEDRVITQVPPALQLLEYMAKPRDKRRKGFPAALLVLEPYLSRNATSAAALAASLGLSLYTSTCATDSEVRVGWDQSTFAIHVCGDENLRRLKALHSAILARDLALANPACLGFRRQGPCFVQVSHISPEHKKTIRENDLAAKRLHDVVKASGIEDALARAGKCWYALSPDWYDRDREEGLLFFLNPCEQHRYHHGWFTVDELRAWAANTGPVLQDPALVVFNQDHPDWELHLIQGLHASGLALRHHPRLEWLDTDRTRVGVHLRPAVGHAGRLPEGLYDFQELMAQYLPTAETA